ncbi:MAG: peptidoglycan D,D-transpeptidase FtsI family protein [Lachnospiraceae bacterium]
MLKNKTGYRKKLFIIVLLLILMLLGLCVRVGWLMLARGEYYSRLADELHERERKIKAKRGRILDRNGTVLADNRVVCNISVIHNQIKDREEVIRVLSEELGLSEEYVKKRVDKVSSIEKIKGNVDKEVGDRIRKFELAGVKVDSDYKRCYPFDSLASKVLGFTGGDNQGIIGLEVKYDELLAGEPGLILTTTDARGVEVETKAEVRKEPVTGRDLITSLDYNIQLYATQLAAQVMKIKEAERVSILVMNPQNGEILALVDVPEFNLNEPYILPEGTETSNEEEKQKLLNSMWRNSCISDTYEPGSIFKMITASAALEENLVTLDSRFHCPGYIMVEDRRIRCHKYGGHGSVSFLEGFMQSCNPTFISLGLKLGVDKYYQYFEQFGLMKKTGVDLPGEAGTIMHKKEDVGPVELATVAFGQSFQITPIQMAATAAGLVNGGTRVTPHVAVATQTQEEGERKEISFARQTGIVSEETSETLKYLLEQVVENGGGINAYVEGYRVGGKTATSQTLPRGSGRYISSFIGFAPADDPQILALTIIYNPQGVYYGGQVAAPVVRQLFENILPYLERM